MTVSRSFLLNENQSRPSTAFRRQILNPAMLLLCLVPCMIPTQALAQGPVGYRLDKIPVNNSNDGFLVNGANNRGMVIGRDSSGTGFVYDHEGWIGTAGTVHLLTRWIPINRDYPVSSCVGINDAGQIVGYFQNQLGERIGFYLDPSVVSPTLPWKYLPKPLGSVSYYGQRINDNGLVFIQSSEQTSNGALSGYGYLYDNAAGMPTLTRIVDPATNMPFQAFCSGLNNSGQVCGSFDGSTNSAGFRLTPGAMGLLETLPCSAVGINNSGVVAGTTVVQSTGKLTARVACRYYSALNRLSTVESSAIDINKSGDVAGYLGSFSTKPALYHSLLGWQPLAELVVSGLTTDTAHWSNSTASRNIYSIADQNFTGFGQIVAAASVTTTSGKGRTAVTITDKRVYMLTPYLTP